MTSIGYPGYTKVADPDSFLALSRQTFYIAQAPPMCCVSRKVIATHCTSIGSEVGAKCDGEMMGYMRALKVGKSRRVPYGTTHVYPTDRSTADFICNTFVQAKKTNPVNRSVLARE